MRREIRQMMDGIRPGRGRASKKTIARELFGVPWGKMEKPEDRLSVALVLRLSSNDTIRRLAIDALDPLLHSSSFATLIVRHGLDIRTVSHEYTLLKKAEGALRAANHLPDLMEQAAIDARSRHELCMRCEGKGEVEGQKKGDPRKVCPICKGEGEVYVPGEVERLKLLFETFNLTSKSAGVQVNIDQRKMSDETLEDLAQSVAPIIEGTKPEDTP